MALSEAEGLVRIATANLETAIASSDPAVFREGAWGFWLQQAVKKALKAWLLCLDAEGGQHCLAANSRRSSPVSSASSAKT